MMEPRFKAVLQATLCITYAWFVGLPTISVIYDQGYSLTWGATKIFANHRIISVTETLLQKSEMSMPEEAGYLPDGDRQVCYRGSCKQGWRKVATKYNCHFAKENFTFSSSQGGRWPVPWGLPLSSVQHLQPVHGSD